MNVNEAVALSNAHIIDLFSNEQLKHLGLEEVERDEARQEWVITRGFSRPWGEPRNPVSSPPDFPRRIFKIVRIADPSQQVLSVKERQTVS